MENVKKQFANTEQEIKESLDILEIGLESLKSMPDHASYYSVILQLMALKSGVKSGKKSMPLLHNMQDFFNLEAFLAFEIGKAGKVVKQAGAQGIRSSDIRALLPEFTTSENFKLIKELLKAAQGVFFQNGRFYYGLNDKEIAILKGEVKATPSGDAKNIKKLNKPISMSEIKRAGNKEIDKKAYARLMKKIEKQFDRKFFIGDIAITDQEYQILTDYLSIITKRIIQSRTSLTDNPAFAVALVQIGIREYQSNRYWPYVEKEIGLKLGGSEQNLIGQSFINTLKVHGKHIQSESERVSSILFHTFVSNYYSKGLFELLFQYYKNDLERDIYRNDQEQMNAFVKTLEEKSKLSEEAGETFTDQFVQQTSKAYKLRQHTLQALSVNKGHSVMRMRRFLRLMDRAFWKDEVPKNPSSRLTILFKEWVEESEAFNHEYKRYKQGEIRNRGKKHFSTPYLFADIGDTKFSLRLPGQIIREENIGDVWWIITTESGKKKISVGTYPVLTGSKTEETEFQLNSKDIFGRISCELTSETSLLRRFSDLDPSEVRLFDMEGDFSPKLFHIPMCAYTDVGAKIESPALTDCFETDGLKRWDFELVDGDVIFLPSGQTMIVGGKYTDGITPRGKVNGVIYRENDEVVPVYNSIPILILTIPSSKLRGTQIRVNGTDFKLGDCEYKEFSYGDAKGQRAIFLLLSQFENITDCAYNQIWLDIPGTSVARLYAFTLVKNLEVNFGNEPFLFEERGLVTFNNSIDISCKTPGVIKLNNESTFVFSISPKLSEIEVDVNNLIRLNISIPVVMWSFDCEEWHTESFGEVWYTDFFSGKTIYIKSPVKHISLSVNEEEDSEEDEDERHVEEARPFEKDIQAIDLTRFRTWLNRSRVRYTLYLSAGKKSKKYADVYVKSFAASCEIRADYEKGVLSCNCDIIGQSQYFIDVIHVDSEREIISKSPLIDGKIEVEDSLRNGLYRVVLYEAEEDESGFDEPDYLEFDVREVTLVNKYDYSNRHLRITGFSPVLAERCFEEFGTIYYVADLKKIDGKTYEGILYINGTNSGSKARVIFGHKSESQFELYLFDEYGEAVDVEYDSRMHLIVRNEDDEENLSAGEKYIRYCILYNEEYKFFGCLEDFVLKSMVCQRKNDKTSYTGMFNVKKAAVNPLGMNIRELGLTIKTQTVLEQKKIYSIFDVVSHTEESFSNIMGENINALNEIKQVLYRLGKDFRKERR